MKPFFFILHINFSMELFMFLEKENITSFSVHYYSLYICILLFRDSIHFFQTFLYSSNVYFFCLPYSYYLVRHFKITKLKFGKYGFEFLVERSIDFKPGISVHCIHIDIDNSIKLNGNFKEIKYLFTSF